VLLELIGSKIPVSQWPTRMAKSQRTGHAREVAQADAAEADRPAASGSAPAQAPSRPEQASVTPLRWRQRAEQARDGIDADRRRRREAAVPVTPKPPPPLGASYRERNVFVLPDDDEEDRGPSDRG
jgi:hypothetical protein